MTNHKLKRPPDPARRVPMLPSAKRPRPLGKRGFRPVAKRPRDAPAETTVSPASTPSPPAGTSAADTASASTGVERVAPPRQPFYGAPAPRQVAPSPQSRPVPLLLLPTPRLPFVAPNLHPAVGFPPSALAAMLASSAAALAGTAALGGTATLGGNATPSPGPMMAVRPQAPVAPPAPSVPVAPAPPPQGWPAPQPAPTRPSSAACTEPYHAVVVCGALASVVAAWAGNRRVPGVGAGVGSEQQLLLVESPWFGRQVEVFHAEGAEHEPLFRARDLTKRLGVRGSCLSMRLARTKTRPGSGIFQAMGYTRRTGVEHVSRGCGALKMGSYFLTRAACRRLARYYGGADDFDPDASFFGPLQQGSVVGRGTAAGSG